MNQKLRVVLYQFKMLRNVSKNDYHNQLLNMDKIINFFYQIIMD